MTTEERFERIEMNLDTLSSLSVEQAERMSELETAMEKLASSQRHLLTAQVVMTEKVGELAASQKYADERLKELASSLDERLKQLAASLDERMSELAESQKHADERLSALIDIVIRQQTPPAS